MRDSLVRLVVAGIVLAVGIVPSGPVASAAPEARSESCTEVVGGERVRWRVRHTFEVNPAYGPLVRVDSLWRSVNGGQETDARASAWELRWDNAPAEWPSVPHDQVPSPSPSFQQLRGTLADFGGQWRSALLSPRLVTPDGACTVYLTPFPNKAAEPDWPKVAVLGDSLLQQLNDPTYNDDHYQGYAEGVLNEAGIAAEVDAQWHSRWTPETGGGGHQLDEFRGLLERDVDGFVVALGARDAIHVASVPPGPDRDARMSEVREKLGAAVSETRTRTPCLVAVTTPENPVNIPGVDGTGYATAARQVNDVLRFIAAADDSDGFEVVDFATQAAGQSWFVGDNLHLNLAGKLSLAAAIGSAARRCVEDVVVHGAAGTFDGGPLAGKTWLPSGQRVRTRAVGGWDFLPGRAPYFPTVAGDGTLLMSGIGHNGNNYYSTGNSMTISALRPDTGEFYTIPLRTDTGALTREVPPPPGYPLASYPLGFEVGDLETINDGQQVVFTGASIHLETFPTPDNPWGAADGQVDGRGMFPEFGVLTKGGDGRWRVAAQWSPRQLFAAAGGDALADRACPVFRSHPASTIRTCRAMQQIAVLPHSGHIVVPTYGVLPPDEKSGHITVLDVDQTPAGEFRVDVVASYAVPEIVAPACMADPACDRTRPENKLAVAPLEIAADPTSAPDDERFVVKFDAFHGNGIVPVPMVEFRHRASTGIVEPSSGPILTGGTSSGSLDAAGFAFAYDDRGNLFASVNGDNFSTRGLVVYAKHGADRNLADGTCPRPSLDSPAAYTIRPGRTPAWGVTCQPDYHVRGPRALGSIIELVPEQATGRLAGMTVGGRLFVVDPDGAGSSMSFRFSGVADPRVGDLLQQHLPGWVDCTGPNCAPADCVADGQGCEPCPQDRHTVIGFEGCVFEPDEVPVRRVDAVRMTVDRSGRAWLLGTQFKPSRPALVTDMDELDQWAISVDLDRLWTSAVHRLSSRTGGRGHLHAETTRTTATTSTTPGEFAVTDVGSRAPVTACADIFLTACPDPVAGLRGGFALGDATGSGVPPATFADYRVVVPKAGRYRVTYRAAERVPDPGAVTARIALTVDGAACASCTTEIVSQANPFGVPMTTHTGPVVDLAQGPHTVRVAVPAGGGGGWQLDWIGFERL